MKRNNIIRTAGILLASSMLSQALALPPTATPDFTLYVSGSFNGAMFTPYCKVGTLHVYQDQPDPMGPQGDHFRAYFCTFKDATDAAPLPPVAHYGKNVLLNNRTKGGSVWGVVPVNEGWQVEYLNIFNRPAGRACVLTGTTYACKVEKATALVANRAGTLPLALAAGLDDLECSFVPKTLTVNEGMTVVGANATFGDVAADTLCRRSHIGFSSSPPSAFLSPNYPSYFPAPTDPTLSANLRCFNNLCL